MGDDQRIGIRELRQQASRWVKRAAAGERITVTSHGRPIAVLGPLAEVERDPLATLEGQGRLRPASATLQELPLPARPAPGHPTAGEALEQLRAYER